MPHRIELDWYPAKAVANIAKHQVSFEEAMPVFLDLLALTVPDNDTADEERWITIGLGRDTRS